MIQLLVGGARVTVGCPNIRLPAHSLTCFWEQKMSKPHLSGKVNGQYKHGRRHTTEYSSWAHMIQRCTNPKNKAWKNYGGRGILVCDAWVGNFQAFLDHIGLKPGPDLSIERIDNNRGYEPGNVKWATDSEQSKNRRPFKMSKLKSACPSGHPYDGSNIYWLNNGARRCLICKRAQNRAGGSKHVESV